VAAEQRALVVCEVKTRSRTRHGELLGTISRAKRSRLRRLAVRWLNDHGVRFDQVRIDLVCVLRDGPGGFTVEHVRGVG
jgi:putative endonuclease